MNGMELVLLGRTLMKIGEAAIPTDGLDEQATGNQSVLIVAADIKAHPDSAVGDIATRTGFPQSKVSMCVARLRRAGAVETTTDATDRRRQLIRPAAAISDRVKAVRAADIRDTLATALDTTDAKTIAEVEAALDTIAEHLDPRALGRLREHAARDH